MPDQDDNTPAPPITKHADDRELGYGAVDARPDDAASGEVAGALKSGGQSAGNAYPGATPANAGDEHDGQSEQAYSGSDNPNSTSAKDISHDRAA